jgi:hypothetical protein
VGRDHRSIATYRELIALPVHQTGVIDNVTELRQVGVLPAART